MLKKISRVRHWLVATPLLVVDYLRRLDSYAKQEYSIVEILSSKPDGENSHAASKQVAQGVPEAEERSGRQTVDPRRPG